MHFHAIEIILALLLAVTGLAYAAKRVDVPYPLLLVVGGLFLALVPGLPRVTLEPEFVFLLFLPPLLYYAATLTSWRDFRTNLRPIVLLAVGLTLFTTLAVALVAMWAVPQMTWASAFVLGAVISPSDAIAATAVANRLKVPRRIVTILEGESLINDSIALVAYRFAVGAAVTGAFSLSGAAGTLVYAALGGIAIGLVVAWAISWLHTKLNDFVLETLVSLLTPYLAYLPAEHLGTSGVLAAIAAGLFIARRLPRTVSPAVRLRTYAVWDVFAFLLNGLVFILIGLELPEIIERIAADPVSWPKLFLSALIISLATVLIRLVWVFAATYLPRLLPSVGRAHPAPPFGEVFLIAWTGMRGIVSLAAALALPAVTITGLPLPGRDLILLITFAVILVTLLAQGLTLPWVIRALGICDAGTEQRDEEAMARYLTTLAAVERLDKLASEGAAQVTPDILQRVRGEYDGQLVYYSQQLSLQFGGEPQPAAMAANSTEPVCRTENQIRRQALGAERGMLVKLRDDGTINDSVLRKVQTALDLEESRLDVE